MQDRTTLNSLRSYSCLSSFGMPSSGFYVANKPLLIEATIGAGVGVGSLLVAAKCSAEQMFLLLLPKENTL